MFTLHYFCGLQARVPLLVLLAILKDFDLRTLKCKPQTLLLKYKLVFVLCKSVAYKSRNVTQTEVCTRKYFWIHALRCISGTAKRI